MNAVNCGNEITASVDSAIERVIGALAAEFILK